MEPVVLSIDEDNHCFVLDDHTKSISTNYRARNFFADFLKATFDSNGTVAVPYNEEQKEQILKKIQDSLSKYGLQQTESSEIKAILTAYFVQRENFEVFSRRAKAIWQNDVDAADFKQFKECIERELPHRTLYPKQLLAAFHLAFSQNACDFSVPGAGKTSIVYAAFAYLKNLPPDHPKAVNKLLVVGPLSSFGPWEDEFLQCFDRQPHSIRLAGGMPKNERDKFLLSLAPPAETPELTLMSYQSLPYNLASLVHFLDRTGNKVMVVLDEAHHIKNVDAGVWAPAALALAPHCKARAVLTGTPLPNGYEDIYNLFEFIWPGKDIINFTIYQLKDMSDTPYDSRVNQLIENISPFFVRIKKSDLHLPPALNHEPTYIDMGPVQREIYDSIEHKYLSYFVENQKNVTLTSELAKARFIRLMQAATNPALLMKPLEVFFREQGLSDTLYIDDSEVIRKIARYSDLEPTPYKYLAVKDLVADLLTRNEKVVIWGTFIQNLKELQAYLKSNGIESGLLIGEVPVERDDVPMETIRTREKIIRQFHEPDAPFKVLIANPFAVSESISLHKACHNAIYLERTFNATHFIQSKDRIHRVGLKPDTVTHYYFLLSRNSIDETIHRRLAEKEQRMLELIESREIPLFAENMDYDIDLNDDIKAIIRDYTRRITKV